MNRSAAFPLTAAKIQQLNAAIDRFVVGGEALEDECLELFLNPPANAEDLVLGETSYVTQSTLENNVWPAHAVIIPSKEVLDALSEITSDAQEMGLYETPAVTVDPFASPVQVFGGIFDPSGLPESSELGTVESPLVNEDLQYKRYPEDLVPTPEDLQYKSYPEDLVSNPETETTTPAEQPETKEGPAEEKVTNDVDKANVESKLHK